MLVTAADDYTLYLDYILTIKQFFNHHRGGGYMFAVSYAYSLKKEVNKEVIDYCREQNLIVGEASIVFGEPSTPVQQLSEAKKTFPDGLILTNIDELMLLTQQEFAYQLNQMREALFALHIPILIWLTPENHSAFTHKAIDLYTRRDLDTLFFPEVKIEANNPILERSEMQLGQTEDAETLRTRIFLLNKQLQSARNDDVPRARIAKEIVLPLIKAYRQLLLFEPVNELINEFKIDFKEDDRDALIELGQSFNRAGNLDAAIQYFEKALQIDLKSEGEASEYVAFDYNNLGNTWRLKGDLNKAVDYFNRALVINQKLFGEESPTAATTNNNLGLVWNDKGDYDKAISHFSKALTINKKILGEESPTVAIRYNNLGLAWKGKGDLIKAINYYEKALAIDMNLFREESPTVAIRYNNLGLAWKDKGDLDKAISYFEKSMKINLKLFEEENPTIANSYNNLGGAWRVKGDLDKAISYYEKARTIDLKLFGDNSLPIANRYNNLGGAWKDKGDLDKAEQYLKKSFEIFNATYGSDNPTTKKVKQNLDMLLDYKSNATT